MLEARMLEWRVSPSYLICLALAVRPSSVVWQFAGDFVRDSGTNPRKNVRCQPEQYRRPSRERISKARSDR